jgi:hypothetical protein
VIAALAALFLGCAYFWSADGRAATVTSPRFGDLVYTAAPGEANQLVLEQEGDPLDPRSWLITDAGAVIRVPWLCDSLGVHSARCPYYSATARLGDRDDRLTTVMPGGLMPPPGIGADGGPGDDWLAGGDSGDGLAGGTGRDTLYAGAGDDFLVGGGGRDALYGGAGSDEMRDGDGDGRTARPDADLLDGGAGSDTVSYAGRTRPVSVDLANPGPVNGERGEGDRLIDIENLVGGKGADRLAGNAADNTIDGGGGRDRLIGRAGDDQLIGGGGSISCGAGLDSVTLTGSGLDYLHPGCEELDLQLPSDTLAGGPILASAYPVKLGPRSAGFSFDTCPVLEYNVGRCAVSVGLRETFGAHRLLARGTVPRRRYATTTVVLARLTRVGRLQAHRRPGVRATVRFRMQGQGLGSAGVLQAKWSMRLKIPG